MIEDISLIIPCQDAEVNLLTLFSNFSNWDVIPNEVIVIDSSKNKPLNKKDLDFFAKNLNIKLKIISGKGFFPGHARNIGIDNSTNSLLAFLDTSTHPNNKWLASGITIIDSKNSQGVWGNTYYFANKFTSKIIRACTYGTKPIRTFPGSILAKDIFKKCGLFVEDARAGEDGDWMTRAELQKIDISLPEEYLTYNDLNHTSTLKIIKKWFRNYSFAAKFPFYRAHRDIYYYFSSLIAVIIAFNWNWILAAWDTESIFYIPNITKISILFILISYIFIRGILIPFKKGVKLNFIFPINFIFITMLSIALDATKIFAFIYAKFENK